MDFCTTGSKESKELKFLDWEIELGEGLKPYIDLDRKRMAILTEGDDDIHLTMELNEDNHMMMRPRWNVNILYKGEKHVYITKND